VGLAQLPVANETKTVAYTAAIVTPGISKDNPWVFRSTVGADQEARTMADYIWNQRHLKRIAVVYLNTDQGLTGSREFKTAFEQLGGQVVASESYNNGAVDLRPQLTKVRAANPEGIYQIGLGQEMGLLLKQASETGLNVQQFGTSSIQLTDVLNAAGTAANGVVYTVGELDPQASKDFVAKYTARWGQEPEVWAGNHYDAIRMIAKAIETNGFSAEGLRTGLLAIRDFPGVTGKTTFGGSQEAAKDVTLKVIKDGKPSPLGS
jgi:branched-chain amino acid transport system substrate-binding protein